MIGVNTDHFELVPILSFIRIHEPHTVLSIYGQQQISHARHGSLTMASKVCIQTLLVQPLLAPLEFYNEVFYWISGE